MIKPLHESYARGVYAGGTWGMGYGERPCSPRYLVVGIPFDATSIRQDRWQVLSDFLLLDPPEDSIGDELWHPAHPNAQRLPIAAAVALIAVTGIGWLGGGPHASGTVLECCTLELYSVEPGRETDVAPGDRNLAIAVQEWLAQKYPAELATFRAGCNKWEDTTRQDTPPAGFDPPPAHTGFDGNAVPEVTTPAADLDRLHGDGNPNVATDHDTTPDAA